MTMIPCQFTSPKKKKKNCGRMALCTFQKASLTVEAAVILPVFLLAMTMLVSVIDICRIKIESQAELTQQAKKLSMYAYGIPDIYEDAYVDLYQIEPYDLPVKLFPFGKINIALRARVHTWTGRGNADEKNAESEVGASTEMVYITDRETVYHTNEGCSHLNLSIVQTKKGELKNLRNKAGGKYDACEKCCDQDGSVSIYYVAEAGTSYHTSLNCSSLKRSTKWIRKSEVAHLQECSRCQILS